MVDFIIFNGQQHSKEALGGNSNFNCLNRAFKFGDSLFESFWSNNNIPLFFDYHFDRLLCGMELLDFKYPKNIKEDILNAINRIPIAASRPYRRIRLSIWRTGEGTYKPTTNLVDYLIEVTLPIESIKLIDNPLKIGLFSTIKKPKNPLAAIKSANSLLYVLAENEANKKGLDTMLLLNDQNLIIEGASANVLLHDGKKWISPTESSGLLPGICRSVLKKHLQLENLWEERDIRIDDLSQYNELVLINAIKGVQLIKQFNNQRFFLNKGKQLQIIWNQLASNYWLSNSDEQMVGTSKL